MKMRGFEFDIGDNSQERQYYNQVDGTRYYGQMKLVVCGDIETWVQHG